MRPRVIPPLLFLVAVLTLTGLAWYATYFWQMADLQRRADDGLSLKSHNAITEVERFRHLPVVVAQDARVRQILEGGSNQLNVDVANRYLEAVNRAAGSDKLYILDADGTAVASSNWNEPKSFVGQKYGFRPYFRDAIASGSGHYYAQGLTTGEPGYFLAHRIEANGKILGASVVKINLSTLESAWRRASEDAALVDRAGIIFLSSVGDWKFKPLYPLSEEDRTRILADKQYDSASINGAPLFSRDLWRPEQSLYLAFGGGTSLVRLHEIPGENWRILAVYDVSSVYRAAALVAAIVFLAAALIFAVGFYLSERRQRSQADELRAFLAHMGVGIAVFDPELRLLAWNKNYLKFNSYPETFIHVGQSLADTIKYTIDRGDYGHGDPDKLLKDRMDNARRQAQVEVRRPDDTWVEIKRNRMPGGRVIHTYNDITERKQNEAELAAHRNNLEQLVEVRTTELVKLNERLQQAVAQTDAAKRQAEEANQAKTTFLNAVSHDIRNPLTAILGYAGLVMAGAKDVLPPRQYSNLEKLASKGRELNELVSDFLDYTRAGRITTAAFRLQPVIEECLVTIEPMIDSERIKVVCDIAEDLPALVQDERKLKRIVINLLSNAVKFTEKGTIRISARCQNEMIAISVADTGIGIAKELLDRIFGEFERVEPPGERPREGTGLGLAISRRFAILMGGTINVTSQLKEGSVFSLIFPIIHKLVGESLDQLPPAVLPKTDAKGPSTDLAGDDIEEKATVLIVDDSRENRDFLAQLFQQDHRVLTASDGRSGVETTRRERPDLILMDLSLPVMNGWDATRAIKCDPELHAIPIIAVTANVTPNDQERASAAGCDGFLSKPVDVEALFSAMSRHLGRRGQRAR